jgi:uncharacterized membrane protein (UPF0127 family)
MSIINLFINNIPFFVYNSETNEQMEQGLMYVEYLPQNFGMLFYNFKNDIANMWMKNTVISLDIIFLNDKKQIIHMIKCAKPLSTTSLSSKYNCKYIIELNCGIIQKYDFKVGNQVYF